MTDWLLRTLVKIVVSIVILLMLVGMGMFIFDIDAPSGWNLFALALIAATWADTNNGRS